MAKKIYHILNGDALYQKFPTSLPGEIIVMRECLSLGPVSATDYNEFCLERIAYLKKEYGEPDYFNRIMSEWAKINNMEPDGYVYLWFEKDMYCQVNMWFILHLMKPIYDQIKLVMPLKDDWTGFGPLGESELIQCYQRATSLIAEDILKIRQLWEAYSQNDFEIMSLTSMAIKPSLPFISKAIGMHFDRIDTDQKEGRLKRLMRKIVEKEGTENFKVINQKFWENAKEYGFGDLQVKQILKQLLHEKDKI